MESMTLDLSQFDKVMGDTVKEFTTRASDWSKPFKAIAETVMIPSFKQNFVDQGRPEKWKALQPSTLIARYYRRNKGQGVYNRGGKNKGMFRQKFMSQYALAQILIDSGVLMKSFVSRGTGNVLRISPTPPYLEMGSNLPYAAAQDMGSPKHNIPARPIAVIQDRDADDATKIIADYVSGEKI